MLFLPVNLTPGKARILLLVAAILASLFCLLFSCTAIKSGITGEARYKSGRRTYELVTKQDSPEKYAAAFNQKIMFATFSGIVAITSFWAFRKLGETDIKF